MIKIRFTHRGEELVTIRVSDSAFYVPNINECVVIQDKRYMIVEKTHHFDTDELFPQIIILECV